MLTKIAINYSPNFTTPARNKKNIKYIVFHYTGMSSESKAIKRLIDENSKVSCHYFIKRNGQIILMVPDLYIAWHAGQSNWNKENSLNRNSIGIEISNKGHQFGYQKFSKTQILSLINLCKYLIKKYNIKKKNVLGHSDIAFDRKKDPGEKFPWEYLAKKNVAFWHNLNKKKLNKVRNKKCNKMLKNEFFVYLSKIGYSKNYKKQNEKLLIKAFQRRFRPQLINGIIDQECLLISKNLA